MHPPFRWQREYAERFRAGLGALAGETDVRFAVENMFPLRVRGREVSAYLPGWDVTAGDEPYRDYTLDLSHTATSQSAALEEMIDLTGKRDGVVPAEARFWRAMAVVRSGDLDGGYAQLLALHEEVGKQIIDLPLYLGILLHRLGKPQEWWPLRTVLFCTARSCRMRGEWPLSAAY